ncbi:hypothetical protein [Microvirga sp. M2]|uniref:hypothetical protein n=1 Tax=Microvirga sp. M2 TaxID=3073270 RepID=UPI0039C36126
MAIFWRLAVGSLVTFATSAAHAEWRYCLAPADAARKVYLSRSFTTDAAHDAIAAAFGTALAAAGIAYDRAQCPRADSERQIEAMRAHAAQYNQEFLKRTAVDVPWSPSQALEAWRGTTLR